ncbi:MAG: metallophosphoesterase [Rikenellaceae bacterium]
MNMRTFLMYSLPILILVAMALAIYYLSVRLAWAFGVSRWFMMAIIGTLFVGSFVAMMIVMRGNYISAVSHIVSNASNILIGVLMFAVCVTLVVDLVGLFVKMQPRTFGFVALGVTALLSIYSLWNASFTRVYNVDITLPNLAQSLRIAHVSDTHYGHFWGERKAKELAKLIAGEDVDAVVITGDMFDGRVRLSADVVRPFSELGVPVYFSEGNHDGYSGSRDIKQLLEDNGVIVLANEKAELKGLQIVGLDYLLPDNNSVDNFHGAMSQTTMQSVLPTLGIEKNRASILLHHNPVGAEYAAENGVNLYLAGHTHAGQLFPATLVAKMMFEYNKGLYEYDENMQIYVSQGTGTFGPPMRLGTHSELTIINLK